MFEDALAKTPTHAAHTEGELARDADLALCEIILAEVFVPGYDCRALNALRLCYWLSWYDRTGMWLSTDERVQFVNAFEDARQAAPPLPERVFAAVAAIANSDGGDACEHAHGG